MKRRELIHKSAAFGAFAAIPAFLLGERLPLTTNAQQEGDSGSHAVLNPLTLPRAGQIPVAFVVSDGAVMIDFAGPWQVFQDVMVPSRGADYG